MLALMDRDILLVALILDPHIHESAEQKDHKKPQT